MSAIPEEDDATSHMHLTLNSDINSVMGAYNHLVPDGMGNKTWHTYTLPLSLVRPSALSIKGDALSPNRWAPKFTNTQQQNH